MDEIPNDLFRDPANKKYCIRKLGSSWIYLIPVFIAFKSIESSVSEVVVTCPAQQLTIEISLAGEPEFPSQNRWCRSYQAYSFRTAQKLSVISLYHVTVYPSFFIVIIVIHHVYPMFHERWTTSPPPATRRPPCPGAKIHRPNAALCAVLSANWSRGPSMPRDVVDPTPWIHRDLWIGNHRILIISYKSSYHKQW